MKLHIITKAVNGNGETIVSASSCSGRVVINKFSTSDDDKYISFDSPKERAEYNALATQEEYTAWIGK